MHGTFKVRIPGVMLLPWLLSLNPVIAAPVVMLILDGSGSMWGRAGEQVKITEAKAVVNELVGEMPQQSKWGSWLTGIGARAIAETSRCWRHPEAPPIGSALRCGPSSPRARPRLPRR